MTPRNRNEPGTTPGLQPRTEPGTCVMTVDVEDWYTSSIDLFAEAAGDHGRPPDESVVPNTLRCLELFAKYGSKATFFILTTVAEAYPDLIREIEHQGHELGVHGYQHRLIYRITPAEFEEDLEKSLDILSAAGARRLFGFRAPYWSITRKSLWALDILQRHGLRYDSSVFPIHRGLYGIADAPTEPWEVRPGFWEFPPATYRLFGVNIPIAGGGYLRMFPYWILSRLVERVKRRQAPVFYLHPYELDPADTESKRELTSLKSKLYMLQQKLGREGNPAKIERLLATTRFDSFANVYGLEEPV